METTALGQLGPLCKLGVALAILLHALALVPQWRARYFNPRFLHLSMYGLLLAVAHGAALAVVGAELPPAAQRGVAPWSLALAVLLNIAIAAQNLLAVVALVWLHRPSAVLANGLRPAVWPMLWASAALAVLAYALAHGASRP